MSSYLLIHLHDAFKKLQESLEDTNRILVNSDLPVWLPEPFEQDRQLAADAITECWNQDKKTYPLTGVVCVATEHLQAFIDANSCKSEFKKEIHKIKKASNKKKSNLAVIIESVAKGRDDEVAQAMKSLRISRLNLLWCYRQILVLPPSLDSLSWTWATAHKSIAPITHKEVSALINEIITDDNDKKMMQDIVNNYHDHQLVRVKKVAPHLRANITFFEGDLITRKIITTPTVVISQDTSLPRIRWPDKEMKNTRLTRSDVKLNPVPIIKALGIYTYLAD